MFVTLAVGTAPFNKYWTTSFVNFHVNSSLYKFYLFYSCYGSIARTSKTKHWYNESDTHTLRLSNTHKWKRFVLICNKQVMHLFLIPLFSSLYYRNILQVIWQSHLTYWNFHKTGFTLSVQQSIHFSIFILNFYQL